MLYKNVVNEVAVANGSGAMEADTISKNGRSLKKQMNRGSIKKIFFAIFTASFILTICCNGQIVGGGSITMITAKPEVKILIAGEGKFTIDWGDGRKENGTLVARGLEYVQTYNGRSSRTITITGDKITTLLCHENQLTSLDVSRNTELTRLGCYSNRLTILDVSKNIALTELRCSANQLTTLDVSKNIALTGLECSNNQLTSLAVSQNNKLGCIQCSYNLLTSTTINEIFGTLNSNAAGEKLIGINNNPGTNDCDRSIATSKGWRIGNPNMSFGCF